MNVLSFHLGTDTAGVGILNKRAFDAVGGPDWAYRSLVTGTNYIAYPTDAGLGDLEQLWAWADVVHLHHSFASADLVEAGRKGLPRLPRKPYVIEFHGVANFDTAIGGIPLRDLLVECRLRHAVPIVSTLNTYLLAPRRLTWVPVPYDTAALVELARGQRSTGDPLRLVQAPTERTIKSTAELLAAVERLQRGGHPVELLLIEGQTWAECLRLKASADIVVDQLILSYGCNALESAGMGIPVIAGAQPDTIAEIARRFGHFPFVRSRPGRLYDTLLRLIASPELRVEAAARGFAYVSEWHNQATVVEQLTGLYWRAAS